MIVIKRILLSAVVCMTSGIQSVYATTKQGWQVVKVDENHQITTYSKQEANKRFRSFRAEGLLSAPLEAAVRQQLDVEHLKKWYLNADESRLLKRVSDTELYYYIKLKTPFGIPARDMAVKVNIEPYSPAKGVLVLRYQAVPDFIPATPDVVRITTYQMVTRLTPRGDQKTYEETEGYAEPGGSLPAWLMNSVQQQTPYHNLLAKQEGVKNYINNTEPFLFKVRE